MSTPPGRAGVDGPISSRIRAILTGRVGICRLGVGRLSYVPIDTQLASNLAASGGFYENWREDPDPGQYGPVYSGTVVVE